MTGVVGGMVDHTVKSSPVHPGLGPELTKKLINNEMVFFPEDLLECECFSGGVIRPPVHLHSLVLSLGVVAVVNENLV